jgi:uncharacterized protein
MSHFGKPAPPVDPPQPATLRPASLTRSLMEAAAPRQRDLHLLPAGEGDGGLLFLSDRSQLYRLAAPAWDRLAAVHATSDASATEEWLRDNAPAAATPPVLVGPPRLHALSLAIAQKCNLGCAYCYAQEGNFGGPSRNMPLDVALAAAECLIGNAGAGQNASLAFLGGEPLLNRAALRATVEHATRLAVEKGVNLSFSITTNGTLLTEDDGDFFEQHAFAVTVSLDGIGTVHDMLRPSKGGGGSYDRIIENLRPLLARQRRMQVSARVTVTPGNLALREALDSFIEMGFHSVGFSPLLASPTGHGEMSAEHLERMLAEMVVCGLAFEREVVSGHRYPFLNMANAMKEIHAGTHRPLPCGAGAGYLGVGADGSLAACHRFVGDPLGAFGSLSAGVDEAVQRKWIAERQVDRHEPCRSCWARYLCGGGCHHEVLHRGRGACDFIRGWLHYCLEAYARMRDLRPDYFADEPSRV